MSKGDSKVKKFKEFFMETNIIQVPKGIRYISDFEKLYGFHLEDFPYILDKSIPGCGFTTWALTNSQNVILASPRKVLMRNKKEQLDKEGKISFLCLPPDEDDEKEKTIDWDRLRSELNDFINQRFIDGTPIKIIVTYDSYRKIKEILKAINPALFETFYTVVDEFQSIFIDSRFKPTAEMEFVDVLADVRRVCYVSATPMMAEYLAMMEQFKDLPYYELDWITLEPLRVTKPDVKYRVLRSINTAIRPFIRDYKAGKFEHKLVNNPRTGMMEDKQSKELVIYLNSVKDIVGIIKSNKLEPEEVSIICSNTDKNRRTIKNKLSDPLKKEYKIEKVPLPNEPRKMFTFCTRTVYLGADFYSDNARSIIISDANVDTLAVDITLDLPQILGRQRMAENPWKNSAYIFTKKSIKYDAIPPEEFEKIMNRKLERTLRIIELFKKATAEEKMEEIQTYENLLSALNYRDDYISINRHAGSLPVLEFNTLVAIAEKRAFVIQQEEYSNRGAMFSHMYDAGISVNLDQTWEVQVFLDKLDQAKSSNERLKILCESDLSVEDMELVFTQMENDTYRNLYFGLGADRCKALGYNYTALKKDYDIKFFNTDRVKERIMAEFKVGDKVITPDIKEKLGIIYQELGYKKTPKASDLDEFFVTKKTKIKAQDGSWINGVEILNLV